MDQITRRRFLQTSAATSTALVVSTPTTVARENPFDRCDRLAQELAHALREADPRGDIVLRVYPAGRYPVGDFWYSYNPEFLGTPDDLRIEAQMFKGKAMRLDPSATEWNLRIAVDQDERVRFHLTGFRR